ncbi:sporulation protein YtxC [Bacillus piscicola]|uniref:sporulation protein YtxC n=1 Tax=Bacillus piscicola TaxID=1632684 RepID=UPI001F09D89D|nr:sporulation protein YtxC [Bacillus piscicola]
MFSIDFESERDSDTIFQWLSNEKDLWEQKGIQSGTIYKKQEMICWEFTGTEEEWQESMIPYLASVLCDYMIEKHELKWVKQYIERHFFSEEEAPAITDIADSLLDGERVEIPIATLLKKRKHFVYQEITDEIKHSAEILWTPLLTFRFASYHHLLMEAAAAAIEEYKWEQEYQTMIESCRHFLKHNQSIHREIHVLLEERPVFTNEKGERIDQWTRLQHVRPTLVFEKQLPFEYMVVSPVVSFAPEVLHVYTDGDEGVVQTLRMIFQENMIVHPRNSWLHNLHIEKLNG